MDKTPEGIPDIFIRSGSSEGYVEYDPVVISETDGRTKRLSFKPKLGKNAEGVVSLSGHLIYEPVVNGTGLYESNPRVKKIGKKDVTTSSQEVIDLYLSSKEIERFFAILEGCDIIRANGLPEGDFYEISQFFKLDTLNMVIKRNWMLKNNDSEIYELLLCLTESSENGVQKCLDAIIRIKTSDDNTKVKLVSQLISSLDDLSIDDLDDITDDEAGLIQLSDNLNLARIRSFIAILKNDLNAGRDEEYWQKTFNKNRWILSQIFSNPLIVFGQKKRTGGSTDDKDGGLVDFVMNNKKTSNLTLVEIKRSDTELMSKRPYRTGLETYIPSSDLSGGVMQLLDYKQSITEEWKEKYRKTELTAYDCNCVLIIGRIEGLNDDQMRSFELYRNSISSVTILTFDELIERISLILSMLGEL